MHRTSSDIANQQSICQSCGICCDGTLFGSAEIDSSGPGPLWPAKVLQSISDGKTLPQPCSAFQKHICVIYPSRPKVCQSFSCALLKEFSSGAISYEDSLSVIQATHGFKLAFYQSLAEVMPVETSTPPGTLMAQFRQLYKVEFDTVEFRKKHSKILLIYARLDYQLRSRFVRKEMKPVEVMTPSGET